MNTLPTFKALFDSVRNTLPYKVEGAILTFTEQVGERIKALGLSRSQFATKLDSSPAYVTKLLSGGTNFTLESMVKVADALDCDVRVEIVPRYSRFAWVEVMERACPTPNSMQAVWSERQLSRLAYPEALSFIGPPWQPAVAYCYQQVA